MKEMVLKLVSPSFLNGSKTPRHDEMHLWLCEPENQILAISTANPAASDIEIITKEQEVPVYSSSYSKYLQGVCDARIKYYATETEQKLRWLRQLIIDFKPSLGSISGVIAQMKVYRDAFATFNDNPHLLVITYDKINRYDRLLREERISILRIEPPIQ